MGSKFPKMGKERNKNKLNKIWLFIEKELY